MKYLIATNWCYPFGGGEEFMYQTMEWAKNQFNAECYWISFSFPNKILHDRFEIKKEKYGTFIYLTGGFNEKTLYMWLKMIKPDIVHHQGHFREQFYTSCEMLKINFLSGFHFWTGGVKLNPETNNKNILDNLDKHLPDEELLRLINKKYCNLYTVSPFVKECIYKIANIDIENMIYSGSAFSRYKINDIVPENQIYVTCINIHKLKGGNILLKIIKELELKNIPIPFIVIRTEFESEELDEEIKNTLNELNTKHNINNIFMNRCEDPINIYKKTKILLAPSLCDETFCRTVNEAMMNGIPVVTTGQGNIKYLVGDKGLIYNQNDITGWVNEIKTLYHNEEYYEKQKEYHLTEYNKYSEEQASKMFDKVCDIVQKKNKLNNIMIFSPWCDQGLGIQSRNYYDLLMDAKYNVFVFGVKPYNANSCLDLQKDKHEWEIKNVYYSKNDRENVSNVELKEFVNNNNIGKCIIPETCFPRIFEIAKYLRSLDVLCYAIPNIEIVQKTEIYKHRYFYKILCNNYLGQQIFRNYGMSVQQTPYVGYGMKKRPVSKPKIFGETVNFLFIGGMNAFSRKHILAICKGFSMAYEKNNNIRLTCTVQKTNDLEIELIEEIDSYKNHLGIKVLFQHMKYSDILDLYYNNHISIQVSKHEGLGLGFYEAIYTGTPVVTLNVPPHNEIINENKNGWIIDCYFKKMTDNKDPIFDSAYFEPQVLCDKILEIVKNKDKLIDMYDNIINDYNDRISYEIFEKRFLESLE